MILTCIDVHVINMLGMQASNNGFKPDFSAKHVLHILSNFIFSNFLAIIDICILNELFV